MSATSRLSAQGYPGYGEAFAERVLVRQCATGESFGHVIADMVSHLHLGYHHPMGCDTCDIDPEHAYPGYVKPQA